MGSVIGLDYSVLPVVASREFASPEWPEIFEALRIMEDAALHAMRIDRG